MLLGYFGFVCVIKFRCWICCLYDINCVFKIKLMILEVKLMDREGVLFVNYFWLSNVRNCFFLYVG